MLVLLHSCGVLELNKYSTMLLGESQLIKKSIQKMITHDTDLSNDELCFIVTMVMMNMPIIAEAHTHKKP